MISELKDFLTFLESRYIITSSDLLKHKNYIDLSNQHGDKVSQEVIIFEYLKSKLNN